MKPHNLARVAAGMAFLAMSAFAQITTVEGIVKGADGKPVQNAQIKIDRTDIKGSYKTKTDKKGHYIYMGLPMGTYDIAVLVEDKQVDGAKGVRTKPGDPIPVNFDLKNQEASKEQMQKAMETGTMTKEMERGMSAEQKAQMEKELKDRSEKMKKNAALNDSFNAGMTAMQAKQWDQAIASFEKAGEMDPTQTAVWGQLAEAYKNNAEGKTGADFDNNINKSLEAYAKLIALKPDDAGSHNNYALALGKAKKFPEMENELKKAAELDPTQAGKYYYNLGASLVNAGQNDAASEAFKKASEAGYADAYYQYGVTLVSKASIGADGKVTPVPGTVEAFQKYLEVAPTGPYAQQAKDMIQTLGASVETKFNDPNAKKSTPAPKKKK
jgi:tetratricopeptide (TPR) repeat protein